MKYLMPAARNTTTGQVIKRQDLSGRRYFTNQRTEVVTLSEILAEDLSGRSGQSWVASPIEYQA